MRIAKFFASINTPVKMLAIALSLGLSTAIKLPVMAAAFNLTDADVVNALEKAKILAPSIRINARVSQDEVMVATYKNPKAEDKDCKIEAVLIAKEVMELAPGEVPRVTVYFYSSSALSRYKQVAVTAGDVKAFATGSLSKEELMASIKVIDGAIVDPKSRIEEHLQEGVYHKKNKITSTIKGDEVLIGTGLDNGMSERGVKFEAVKLAENAFEAAPASVKKVIITFEDRLERKQNQVLSFEREELKTLGDAIDGTLKTLKVDLVKFENKSSFVPGTKLNLDTVEIKDGPLKSEREQLLNRLKELTKAGTGFGTQPTDELMAIEDKVGVADERELKDRITKLSDLIGRYEANLKDAKEHKAIPSPSAASKTPPPAAKEAPAAHVSGKSPEALKAEILANPDAFIDAMARDYIKISPVTNQVIGKYKTADEVPNFRRNLQVTIDTLKEAGRGAEAEKFQKRLDAIRAKYGN